MVRNLLRSATAILLLTSHSLTALAQASQSSDPDWRYWWPGPWHMWGGWGFGWIFPLLMMVAMVALCIFLMNRSSWMHGSHHDTTASALRLLNERFAKGEISKEEFEEKRSILARRS